MSEPAQHTATHTSPAARSYAQAVLELATEWNASLDQLASELRDLRQVIVDNPVFGRFLADPAISRADRTKAVSSGRSAGGSRR